MSNVRQAFRFRVNYNRYDHLGQGGIEGDVRAERAQITGHVHAANPKLEVRRQKAIARSHKPGVRSEAVPVLKKPSALMSISAPWDLSLSYEIGPCRHHIGIMNVLSSHLVSAAQIYENRNGIFSLSKDLQRGKESVQCLNCLLRAKCRFKNSALVSIT